MNEWITTSICYRAVMPVSFSTSANFIYRAWASMSARDAMPGLMYKHTSDGELASNDVIVIGEEGNFLLAGALTAFRSVSFFRAVWRGGRFSEIQVEQPGIKAGETPEEIIVLKGADWRELLFQYAEAAAAKCGRIMPDTTRNMTGYCTWYYYYENVTGQDLLDNIDALAKNRSPYAAEYVQIDDGYQKMQGDWFERNEDWTFTLKTAADKILAAGMKPGIWLMPFVASTASSIYHEHPDWFVQDAASGKPVERGGWSPAPNDRWCCLDATNPAVIGHIQNVFRRFHDMGYVYFKLDGLNYGLTDGLRMDASATSVSAFRTLVKAIKEAVPDDLLMACGGNYLVCLGLFDNARASCDTSRYYADTVYPNQNFPMNGCDIRSAVHQTMNNFWRFDRWFRMDPDSLMARQDNAFYTAGEARISVLSGIVTGVCLTSDNLATISPERNRLLGAAQRYRLRDARPFQYHLGQWPQFFEGSIDGKRGVAVFNDSEQVMVCDFAKLGLPERCAELLTGATYAYGVELPPHDAALFTSP
ncbi:MAG: alpha-galactosidase [Victivallales bacterium]|nr:alpha-galactosidase [Victivallales bacterium]